MEDSTNTKRNIDLYGGSDSTFDSKENDLDERIYIRRKIISTLKEIKELSKENLKKKEKLHEYELENEKRKTIVGLNAQ